MAARLYGLDQLCQNSTELAEAVMHHGKPLQAPYSALPPPRLRRATRAPVRALAGDHVRAWPG